MSQLKLAFFVSEYREFGGMQRNLAKIARECLRRGASVDIYTGAWHGEAIEGVNVIPVSTRALHNHSRNTRLARYIKKHKLKSKYDLLVGFTKIPGLDVYYAGDPCFAEKFQRDKPKWYRFLPRYRGLLQQEEAVFAKEQATQILLVAHEEQRHFQRHYGTPSQRFHFLPPGIEKNRLEQVSPHFDKRSLRLELNLPLDCKLILMLGSGFRVKGLDRAIEALASLPATTRQNTHLIVVGKDDEKPYQRLADKLGVGQHIHFLGGQQQIAQYYHSADLLLHPAYHENTGNVLIEAMYCGLPVLCTESCGFAKYVASSHAGEICRHPFKQTELNQKLANMLLGDLSLYQSGGQALCAEKDFYHLAARATDVLMGPER